MIVTIIQGFWKEDNKNIYCEGALWPRGALKFQIAFWALRPTSPNKLKQPINTFTQL